MDVGRIWDCFIEDYPEALEVAKNYSSQGNRPNMEMAWKGALKQFFQTRAFTDIILKDKYEFDSPLDPELWEAWLKAAADPEQRLVDWIWKGARALGMSREIPCCGIFPTADDRRTIKASRTNRSMPELSWEDWYLKASRWSSRRTRRVRCISAAQCRSWHCW